MDRTPASPTVLVGNGQRGLALIMLLLLLSVALSSILIGYIKPYAQTLEGDKITAAALARAKDALIGYAVNNDNHPGILPCPDVTNDGSADAFSCGGAGTTAVGRLPWKTLGLPPLRDGAGECLWYAVSVNFKNDNTPPLVNSDSAGTLIVNDLSGTPVYSGINALPAIIFAAGALLPGQDRSGGGVECKGNNLEANYLDGGNQNGAATNTFVTGLETATFNDKSLAITHDVLFHAVHLRVAAEVRTRLNAYYALNQYYPYASAYGDASFACDATLTSGRLPKPGYSAHPTIKIDISSAPGCKGLQDWASGFPAWFVDNNWHLLTHYALAPACGVSTLNCAGAQFLTVNNVAVPTNNKQAVVIVGGRALAGQSRPCNSAADCFEGENATMDYTYIKTPVSATINDVLLVVAP